MLFLDACVHYNDKWVTNLVVDFQISSNVHSGNGFTSIKMFLNLGIWLKFSWSFLNFSPWLIGPSKDVKELGTTHVDEDPTPIIMWNLQPYFFSDEKSW
jgi:hypothetical protein